MRRRTSPSTVLRIDLEDFFLSIPPTRAPVDAMKARDASLIVRFAE